MFLNKGKINYKSKEELSLIKISGDLLGKVHGEISKNIKSGITTNELDKIAYQFIKDNSATPSFLNYKGYPNTLCISVNETVVHGIPNKYKLKEGDIVSVDCGVFLNGYHADSAYTYRVGKVDNSKEKLLKATYNSLIEGINAIKVGSRIGDISYSIQSYVEERGYSVVRELVGHGVGRDLHEEPEVPNFGKRGKGQKMMNGMVIAIEPMINQGSKDVCLLDDGWTVNTLDGKASAHFEHTVGMFDDKVEILTTFKYIVEDQII